MTAQELIASSLRLCGAIAVGEVPSADEFETGLDALRDILENWTVEGLTPHATIDQTFHVTAGVASYTIGPGAEWDGYRPIRIRGVKFDGFPVATTRIDYNAGFPVGTVTIVDDCGGIQDGNITLTSELAFQLPADSTAEMVLPPGYAQALRFCLASDLAPEYGLDVRPDIEAKARTYKADLKRANIKRVEMTVGAEFLGADWCGAGSSWSVV